MLLVDFSPVLLLLLAMFSLFLLFFESCWNSTAFWPIHRGVRYDDWFANWTVYKQLLAPGHVPTYLRDTMVVLDCTVFVCLLSVPLLRTDAGQLASRETAMPDAFPRPASEWSVICLLLQWQYWAQNALLPPNSLCNGSCLIAFAFVLLCPWCPWFICKAKRQALLQQHTPAVCAVYSPCALLRVVFTSFVSLPVLMQLLLRECV